MKAKTNTRSAANTRNSGLGHSNGTSQIFPAACVSYVLRALGFRTLGDRMKKRSEIFRDAMKYLAVDEDDYFNRCGSQGGICGAMLSAMVYGEGWGLVKESAEWLFDNGKGKKTKFYADVYWLPRFTAESYTARIMLLELGALMSEEEGN